MYTINMSIIIIDEIEIHITTENKLIDIRKQCLIMCLISNLNQSDHDMSRCYNIITHHGASV